MLRQDIRKKFLDLLVKEKKLSSEQAKTLIEFESFSDLEDNLKKTGWLKAEDLARVKAKYFKLPYVDLIGEQIKPEIINQIPKALAENYQAISYSKHGNKLQVALIEPTDLKAQEAVVYLAREKDLKVDFGISSKAAFFEAFKQYSALKKEVEEYLGVAEEKFGQAARAEKLEKTEDLASSAPIAKMVSVILRHAVDEGASDIHIEPVMNQTRVRYRIDGIMKTSLVLPKYVHSAIVSRIKVMAKLKIDETRVPQDGRIRLKISDNDIDFRVSTLPLYKNEKVVMRILDTSGDVLTLEDLGFDGKNLEVIKANIEKPHGMFLVTGPTGSGKTTTLYANLRILNKESVNIVTLEDPVEYFLKGVNQSQINSDVGLTFASGLRSILRQDPDIILVGEIRDGETADLAIHAALTGHLMLSTLHTNDAFGAIPRLVDLKVEPFLLASTLNVIIAQRLVRKLCQYCKKKVAIPDILKTEARSELSTIMPENLPKNVVLNKMIFWQGQGCKKCGNSGYKGRLAIAEVLPVTTEVKDVIASKKDWHMIKEIFTKLGMLTLKQDGIIKALRGFTTLEEIMRVTKE